MNRTQQVRNEILIQLYGYRPAARPAQRIARLARGEGELPDLTESEVAVEADYLAGKGLVEVVPDPVAQGAKRFKLAAAGIDYLESNGLI